MTSATRSRKTSETRDVEFIETLDASSLERWLPVVVRQLKEVGLFPVFVVDELRIEPWTKPPDEFTKRLDGCRMVMNHGALFCLMVDGRTWLTLDHYEDALRGAVTDRTFLVARPDEMQPEGLAGADRDVVVLRARARPIALKSAVRGLAIRRPPTVLLTGNPHAQPLEAVLQRAIEAALKATRPMRDIEEAIAVDLAYAWVSAWREGAVRVAATGAADTTWARGNGWIAPDADAPARVTVFRDLLVGELTQAGVARRVGTELRLLFGPDGRRIDSWFATAAEAALWLAEAEASALSLTGLPLEHLEESAGLTPVRALSQSLGATASEPSVRQSRAEALAEHVEVLQALMVGLRVLGTYGGTATDAAGRNFGKLRRFEEHARRAWTPADTDALVTLAGLAAPGPWTPLPGPWAADVARLSKWWGGAAAPSDAAVERVREAGRRLWARRTPANADAPPDTGLDPRDVLLALLLPDLAPMVLRER